MKCRGEDIVKRPAQQSLELLNRISGKVDDDFQRRWDFLMQQYRGEQVLRKMRIEAMVEIAKAYYQRTQPTYHITNKSLF